MATRGPAEPGEPDNSVNEADPIDANNPVDTVLNLAKSDLDNNEGVLALLKEMNESLRDLREHSARIMRLSGMLEAEEQHERGNRRESWFQDSSRDRRARREREPRRNTRAQRRRSRSVRSLSYCSYTDSDSGPGRALEEAVEEALEGSDHVEAGKAMTGRTSVSSSRRRAKSTDSKNGMTIIEVSKIPVERRSIVERRDRRRSRAFRDVVVVEEQSDRVGSRNPPRSRRAEEVRTNDRKLKGRRVSSDGSALAHSNDESVDVDEETRSDTNSGRSARSVLSSEPDRPLLKGYNTERVEYGGFPHPHLYEQLFGGTDHPRQEIKDEHYSWLKEKGLIFARDERCSFAFDLANLTDSHSFNSVTDKTESIECFAQKLREKGGFFFFRESYMSDKDYRNKIYNGTYVIRCKDNRRHALPRLSRSGAAFSAKFPQVIRRGETARLQVDERTQQMIDESRLSALTADIIGSSDRNDALSDLLSLNSDFGPLEPDVTYHYRGKPKSDSNKGRPTGWVTGGGPGPDIIHREGRQVYEDPHITAPWRRLCVLTGLSRISRHDQSSLWRSVPLFARESTIDRGSSDGVHDKHEVDSNDDQDGNVDDDSNSDYGSFYDQSMLDHLSYEQLSRRQLSRKRIVKFQFSWYEILPHGNAEDRKFSGRLYQDQDKRSIQLQSFMAIGIWQKVDEDRSGDSKFWTLIIMAPAFFYHKDVDDTENENASKELNDLIGPLKNILPTMSATLLMLLPKIIAHWTKISDHVEHFIAGQDSFLHESKHDRLLFDDDSFTRSRQYFWVITSTGEFSLIIDGTINHYKKVAKWVSKDNDELRKHRKVWTRLETIRDRFERQRERASELRESLFSASSVVESRLSTRLGQNVKLLTYVSIFYLPLAFCAALWAIPNITDTATRTPFIVAAFLVGLVTYFIVFNLDALVTWGWGLYSRFRKGAIRQMIKDSKGSPRNDPWQKRALGFKRFEPDRGEARPSEWFIVWYTLLYIFGRSIKVEKSKGDDESNDSSDGGSRTTGSETSSATSSYFSSSYPSQDGSAEESRNTSESEDGWIRWLSGQPNQAETALAPPASAGIEEPEPPPKKTFVARVRERFRKPGAPSSASASNGGSTPQDRSWVSWLRGWFGKRGTDREKRGPNTV